MLLPVQSLQARLELPVPLLLGQPKLEQHQRAPPPEPQWLAQLKRERTARLARSVHHLYPAATRTLIRDRQAFRSVRDNCRPNLLKRSRRKKMPELKYCQPEECSWNLPEANNWRMRTETSSEAHSRMGR